MGGGDRRADVRHEAGPLACAVATDWKDGTMTYKMSDLKGIDENQLAQLRQGGVENTDEMMTLWNDPARRLSLTTSTGLTDEQLTAPRLDGARGAAQGCWTEVRRPPRDSGSPGRKSLATYTPETLVQRLGDVSAAKSLTGPLPSLVEVGAWFAELKPEVVSETAAKKS
jgi:hypothetical protein